MSLTSKPLKMVWFYAPVYKKAEPKIRSRPTIACHYEKVIRPIKRSALDPLFRESRRPKKGPPLSCVL